jgi:hypothetical protein
MTLNRLRPDEFERRPILLSDIYSFARRRSGEENRLLKIKIKLLILFGQEITFAGSVLLLDRFVIELFNEMRPFFEAGYIVPDLRSEADSFQHSAEIRTASRASKKLMAHSANLDATVSKVIEFDSFEVSSLYSYGLLGFIDEVASATADREEVERLLKIREIIASIQTPFTLDYVKGLAESLKHPNDFKRMAELLYCVSGGEVVGAHTFLPGYFIEEKVLWGDLLPRTYFTTHELQVIESLFEYYAIDVSRLEHLSPEQVIELRNDRRVSGALAELDKIVTAANEALILTTSTVDDYKKAVANASSTINSLVREACNADVRKDKWFYFIQDLVVDVAAIPFSNVGTRVMRRFVNWLNSSRYSGMLGKSMTPLSTSAEVIRNKLMGLEGASGALTQGQRRMVGGNEKQLTDSNTARKLLR